MGSQSDSSPVLGTIDMRRDERVAGFGGCGVSITSLTGESLAVVGEIHDESADGMGIRVNDLGSLRTGDAVIVSDFDGQHLAEIRHISPLENEYLVGLQWESTMVS